MCSCEVLFLQVSSPRVVSFMFDYFLSLFQRMPSSSPKEHGMLSKVSMKRKHFLLIAAFLILVVVVLMWQNHPSMFNTATNIRDGKSTRAHTLKFTNEVIPYEKFRENCYRDAEPSSLADLKKYISKLNNRNVMCLRNYHLFQSVYRVFYRYGEIAISDTFLVKLQKWFKGNQELVEMTRNQSLVYIHNMYSYESVVINIVREKRPIAGSGGSVLSYVDKIVNESAATCSFCSYVNETATDDIGRMESKLMFSVITTSTFKADIYYASLIMKTHHPLYFSQEQFIDAIDVMMRWFRRVHLRLPSHLYRVMYWDLLPKAGSKQVHPVWQITVGDYSYHSRWNQLHAAAVDFSEQHGGLNYWTTLLQMHTLLGLSYR